MKINILATHMIPNVSETLAKRLSLPDRFRSIGIITTDCDDATYCALDEATKSAAVEVHMQGIFLGGIVIGGQVDAVIDLNFDVIGYVDPGVNVNIIRDGKIVEKLCPDMPERVEGVIKCKNPRCITSTEQELPHVFKLTDKEKRIYRCIYCESKAK